MSEAARDFSPFPFAVRALSEKGAGNRYLVYRSSGECVAVTASSADEAVRLSGVETPLRIRRDDAITHLMLDKDMFT